MLVWSKSETVIERGNYTEARIDISSPMICMHLYVCPPPFTAHQKIHKHSAHLYLLFQFTSTAMHSAQYTQYVPCRRVSPFLCLLWSPFRRPFTTLSLLFIKRWWNSRWNDLITATRFDEKATQTDLKTRVFRQGRTLRTGMMKKEQWKLGGTIFSLAIRGISVAKSNIIINKKLLLSDLCRTASSNSSI